MRAEVTLPCGFCLFLSGYLREYSSQWAHISGQENYPHSFQREKEKETELHSQVTTLLRDSFLFVNLPVHLCKQKWWETSSTFNCGKSLSLAAYKLSMLYTYLMSFFIFPLQKSLRSVMLDGHKFKRKAGGEKRNKRIIDQQRIYCTFSSSIPLLPGL